MSAKQENQQMSTFLSKILDTGLPGCVYDAHQLGRVRIFSPDSLPDGLPQHLRDRVGQVSTASVVFEDGSLGILFNPDIYGERFSDNLFALVHELAETGFVTNLPGEKTCQTLYDDLQTFCRSAGINGEPLERLSDFDHFTAVWAEFMAAMTWLGESGVKSLLSSTKKIAAQLNPEWADRISLHPDVFMARIVAEKLLS